MINLVLQVTGLDGCGNVVCLLCEGGTSVKFLGETNTVSLRSCCLKTYLLYY